eukprot:scaffold21703_cov33-Prasinocladus_malaysianus.AAC.2
MSGMEWVAEARLVRMCEPSFVADSPDGVAMRQMTLFDCDAGCQSRKMTLFGVKAQQKRQPMFKRTPQQVAEEAQNVIKLILKKGIDNGASKREEGSEPARASSGPLARADSGKLPAIKADKGSASGRADQPSTSGKQQALKNIKESAEIELLKRSAGARKHARYQLRRISRFFTACLAADGPINAPKGNGQDDENNDDDTPLSQLGGQREPGEVPSRAGTSAPEARALFEPEFVEQLLALTMRFAVGYSICFTFAVDNTQVMTMKIYFVS